LAQVVLGSIAKLACQVLAFMFVVRVRPLVLLVALLPGAARRRIHIADSLKDARQHANAYAQAREMSAEAREAFLPRGSVTAPFLRPRPQAGASETAREQAPQVHDLYGHRSSMWRIGAGSSRPFSETSYNAPRRGAVALHAGNNPEEDGLVPKEAMEQVPPEKLAEAWQREEGAKKLFDALKGCNLYLVGLGARKQAVGRALARRLSYRFLDTTSLMCSTYAQMKGSEGAVTMKNLLAKEPLPDIAQLGALVMREVQAFTRAIIVAWDGAVEPTDFMVMQQGIVVNVLGQETLPEELALPPDDSEATVKKWADGHSKADVTVTVEEGEAADDVAAKLIENVLTFIEQNPRMSDEWRAEAEEKLAQTDAAKQQ